MISNVLKITKSFLHLTGLIALVVVGTSGQTTTSSGSVSLDGAGTLNFTVTHQGLTPCNSGSLELTPSFQRWTFGGFSYVDAGGTSHSLSGGTSFVTVAGSGSTCPASGGSPVVLGGNGYSITATPSSGSLTASLSFVLLPKYYVLSILYAPPGNQSSSGFSNSSSQAATTSISKSFEDSVSTAISATVPGGSGISITTGSSEMNGNSQSFVVTTTDQTGSAVDSNRNPIDHTQDTIYLLLNPSTTVTPTGTNTSEYTMGTVIGSNGQPEDPDIIGVSVEALQNPTTIAADIYNPRLLGGILVPGLSNVCAKPVPSCTTAPCGCVASDFAPILAQDPLIGASVTTAPSTLVPNRYVSIGNTTLEGPSCAGCDEHPNTFQESDGTTTSDTMTQTDSYSVGYSTTAGIDFFGGGLSVTNSNTFTWTNSMSAGESNDQSHTESLTVQTSSVGCLETVDIYEDTVYHTFAFALEAPPPSDCD
jgi:hypothetical protein